MLSRETPVTQALFGPLDPNPVSWGQIHGPISRVHIHPVEN